MAGRRATAMDTEGMTEQLGPDSPLDLSQIEKARRIVVAQALREHPDDKDKAIKAARETMMMLGIHSSQKHLAIPTLNPNNMPNMGSLSPYRSHVKTSTH